MSMILLRMHCLDGKDELRGCALWHHLQRTVVTACVHVHGKCCHGPWPICSLTCSSILRCCLHWPGSPSTLFCHHVLTTCGCPDAGPAWVQRT